ncbi:zinc-binding dehydrogenase [Mariprofundus erugo]|uniref:zinc-binding dehydrogenase n=1 Tax=Mariprofundus erugo TaxID=2528639 RepID=UPI0010FEF782|nr:zinc-binding dehydrogenase [Mariprofundus erugo]TLS77160.1 zinc-binding dehydrogenase [Mariprofundus erugo]
MRAVMMNTTGEADVLTPGETTLPTCGPDDLLIRIMAAGVNPVDTKLRSRGLYFGSAPAILGCDGAGIVEATGENVSRFEPGDAVYYCYGGLGQQRGGQSAGNYAEYIAIPEICAAQKPDCLDFTDAAGAPLVLITAWESLFDRARLQAGQKIYIGAGAGGVGHVAIQLAKLAGCSVATSVSSDEKAEFVRQLGADLIINYREQQVTEALLAWTDGTGVDVAFDTVGGQSFNQLVTATRVYGDIVTILQVPEDTDWKTIRMRNIRVSQELMLTPAVMQMDEALAYQGDILEQCAQLFDERKLSVFVSETLPLEQAAKAHQMIEAGSMTGKLVLEIGDSDA